MSRQKLEEIMKALKEYCENNWGAQKNLADYLGTTPQLVNGWIVGGSVPSAENAFKILNWLELVNPRPLPARIERGMTALDLWSHLITEEIRDLAIGRVLDGGDLAALKDPERRKIKLALILVRHMNDMETLTKEEKAILSGT
jgi:hypothetical protein